MPFILSSKFDIKRHVPVGVKGLEAETSQGDELKHGAMIWLMMGPEKLGRVNVSSHVREDDDLHMSR
jgi:hypothetical protein